AAPGYAGALIRSWDAGSTGTIIGPGRTVDGLHWSNVRMSDGSTGWIASLYITRTGSAATTAPTRPPTRPAATTTRSAGGTVPAGTVYRTTTRLNIRQSPDTSSGIVSTLPTGTLVTAMGATALANGYTWARVQAGPTIGWVAMKYL